MTARSTSDKMRLDELLVRRALFSTRSRARDAILRRTVRVNGAIVSKPGFSLSLESSIETDDSARAFVSRAALKLIAGLEHFSLKVSGLNALDIGASAGGFTQVLLEGGAAHVTCVDVGHGQMHASLLNDSRISSLEGLNARNLAAAHLGGKSIGFVVSDVSFISLKLALPNALALAEPGAECLLLVKPQFEAGRRAIGKGGLLKDKELGETIARDLSDWLGAQPRWRSLGLRVSPIEGGGGNREFLLAGIKDQ
jgi:23S rRNA (cytidine1920-2'-O)/16S rRNA (cytidine1409-2'-O)-methyltransferase